MFEGSTLKPHSSKTCKLSKALHHNQSARHACCPLQVHDKPQEVGRPLVQALTCLL